MGMARHLVTSKQPKFELHSAEKGMTEVVARRQKVNGLAKSLGFIQTWKHLSTFDLAIVYVRQLSRADKMSSLSKPTDK